VRASWKVEGGDGQFAAARGFITSTFTIGDSGERSDFHCGLILPEEWSWRRELNPDPLITKSRNSYPLLPPVSIISGSYFAEVRVPWPMLMATFAR
jgi:hypothetical protein